MKKKKGKGTKKTLRPKRTVPVDGSKIREFRLARNMSQAQLASADEGADVGLRTLQRMEASEAVEERHLESVAKFFGVPTSLFSPLTPGVNEAPDPQPDLSKFYNGIAIIIRGDFSPELIRMLKQEKIDWRLVVAMVAFEIIRNPVLPYSVSAGSIIIRFDCTSDDAQRILQAFHDHELDYLGIDDVQVGPPFRAGLPYLRPARAQRLLGGAGMLLAGAAGARWFLPQLPWIGAVALVAAGGLAGVAGLFLSWRRKRGYLLPVLAVLLNALLLAWLLTKEVPPEHAPVPNPAPKRLEFTANKFLGSVHGRNIIINFGTHTTLKEVLEDEDGTITLYLPTTTPLSGFKVLRMDPQRLSYFYRYTEDGVEKTIAVDPNIYVEEKGDTAHLSEAPKPYPGTYILKVAPRQSP